MRYLKIMPSSTFRLFLSRNSSQLLIQRPTVEYCFVGYSYQKVKIYGIKHMTGIIVQ